MSFSSADYKVLVRIERKNWK